MYFGGRKTMKIATVSENGTTISQHFGRAPMYVVLTVENGRVVSKENRLRSAAGTCACHGESHSDCHSEADHGTDIASQVKHGNMADAIADCDVIIARGMGYGAYASLKIRNLEAIITDQKSIDQAVDLFLKGKLDNLMEKLH
jgi:predicted Fe-Mo cluster-binding NifX family protein